MDRSTKDSRQAEYLKSKIRISKSKIYFLKLLLLIRLAVIWPEAGARVKLHFRSYIWLHLRPGCRCRLGWANSGLCWVSLHSTQPTFFRSRHEMRNPTTADFETGSQQFIFFWSDWTPPRPEAALLWNFREWRMSNDDWRMVESLGASLFELRPHKSLNRFKWTVRQKTHDRQNTLFDVRCWTFDVRRSL